jgi:AraC-like DNA-binding protein
MTILDGHRALAPRFDVLQDAGAVEGLDPEALAIVIEWLRRSKAIFTDRVRTRAGVLPPGVSGLALAGLAPWLALGSPLEIFASRREAMVHLGAAPALCDEVDALVERARGLPEIVIALRHVLAEARGAIDVATAAQRLGVAVRSLQRQLAGAGRSFRGEQADARFAAAEALLAGDDKLAAIAARLGLSEDGLTELVRARTGLTPGELRRRR